MPLRSEAYYAKIAAAALERAETNDPPVPLRSIIASFGIPVRPVSLPDFFTAATVHEDGLPVMVVNSAKPEQEQRAALAHMLAHVLLVLEGETDAYPKDTQEHVEADRLARELVMPRGMVTEQSRMWFNDHRYLARLFGVDETEMVQRMRELGLLKNKPDSPWDF